LFTALTVRVVVLLATDGAVTFTEMIWLMVRDGEDGTGFGGVTLTTVQVPDGEPGVTPALTVNVDAYGDESV